MRGRPGAGFTLIEVLVVMIIIVILAAALVIIVNALIDRARAEKTGALIHLLDGACSTYAAKFKEFPPRAPHVGSKNLHYYLGRDSTILEQVDPPVRKPHRRFIEFKADWLQNPAAVDADPPSFIVDAWGTPLEYDSIPPATTNANQVLIRSSGPDKTAGTGDEMDNQNKEF
jgi:prepilin-type N-terminal cleavage/methylation domain-containing protein